MNMPPLSYVYEARTVGKSYDGDTFSIEARMGLAVIRETSARLYGINCPELYRIVNGKRVLDADGDAARKATQEWLDLATGKDPWPLIVLSKGADKYGNRTDCIVWRKADGTCLNEYLVAGGFALARDYGAREV